MFYDEPLSQSNAFQPGVPQQMNGGINIPIQPQMNGGIPNMGMPNPSLNLSTSSINAQLPQMTAQQLAAQQQAMLQAYVSSRPYFHTDISFL